MARKKKSSFKYKIQQKNAMLQIRLQKAYDDHLKTAFAEEKLDDCFITKKLASNKYTSRNAFLADVKGLASTITGAHRPLHNAILAVEAYFKEIADEVKDLEDHKADVHAPKDTKPTPIESLVDPVAHSATLDAKVAHHHDTPAASSSQVTLGPVTLVALGTVPSEGKENLLAKYEYFFNNQFAHVIPVGYHITRKINDDEIQVKIEQTPNGPEYNVTVNNKESFKLSAPSRVLSKLRKLIPALKSRSISGAELIGFSDDAICKQLKALRQEPLYNKSGAKANSPAKKEPKAVGSKRKQEDSKTEQQQQEPKSKRQKEEKAAAAATLATTSNNDDDNDGDDGLENLEEEITMGEADTTEDEIDKDIMEEASDDEEDEENGDEEEENLADEETALLQEAAKAEAASSSSSSTSDSGASSSRRPRRAAAVVAEEKTKADQKRRKGLDDSEDKDYDPQSNPDAVQEEDDDGIVAASPATIVVKNPFDKSKSILKTPEKSKHDHSRLQFSPDVTSEDGTSLEIKCPACHRSFSKYQIHSHFKVRHLSGEEGEKMSIKDRKAFMKDIAAQQNKIEHERELKQKQAAQAAKEAEKAAQKQAKTSKKK